MAQSKKPGAPNPASNAKGVTLRTDRVLERLEILKGRGISSFEASESMGANRVYLNSLVNERKSGVRAHMLPKIAAVLECSISYLTGESDDVGVPPKTEIKKASVSPKRLLGRGFVDDGAWRPVSRHTPVPVPGIGPLPDFDSSAQSAYVRIAPDNTSQEVVVTITPQEYEAKRGALVPGLSVIVERRAVVDGQECLQHVTRTVSADGGGELAAENERVVAVVAYEARFKLV